MNSDFKDLLQAFSDFQVKYLVIGGYAVMYYSEPRFTKDIDLLVEATQENATKLFNALKQFGAPVSTMSADDFSKEGYFFQMGIPPNRIDILMSVPGVKFAEAWSNKVEVDMGNNKVWFIAKKDLISAKKAAGRKQDLLDLEKLT